MDTVAIIPARFNSNRFPGKPLVKINGKQMILHVVERVKKIPGIDRVIVATDNSDIQGLVVNAGHYAVMTGQDHESGMDRVAEVARRYDSDTVILNVQGDLPFFNPEVGKRLIAALKVDSSRDIATPVKLRDSEYELRNGNNVKALFAKNYRALFFTRFPVGTGTGQWYHHIGVYAYRNETLQQLTTIGPSRFERFENLEQLRALEYGYKIYCMVTTNDCGVDVNCPDDLKRIG